MGIKLLPLSSIEDGIQFWQCGGCGAKGPGRDLPREHLPCVQTMTPLESKEKLFAEHHHKGPCPEPGTEHKPDRNGRCIVCDAADQLAKMRAERDGLRRDLDMAKDGQWLMRSGLDAERAKVTKLREALKQVKDEYQEGGPRDWSEEEGVLWRDVDAALRECEVKDAR